MGLTIAFEAVSVVCAALAAGRMWKSGLHARYRFLFAYLIFLVAFQTWPIMLDVKSKLYFRFWVWSEPMNWIFEILVVRELCGLVLARYQGLCTLGRWGMYGGMVISGAISLFSLLARIPSTVPHRSLLLYYLLGADRGINLALAVFLLLMMALGSRYPVPLSRNVVINAVVFTVVFLSNTLAMLLHTLLDLKVSSVIDCALTGVGAASVLVWFFALTPRGEAVQVELARLEKDQEEALLTRLDDLNSMVLRMGEV